MDKNSKQKTSSNINSGEIISSSKAGHLQNDVSYYRINTTYQWVTGIISILLCLWNPIVGIIVLVCCWYFEKNVKVVPYNKGFVLTVPKSEWKNYCKAHNIPLSKEYKRHRVAKLDSDEINQKVLNKKIEHEQELQAEYKKAVAPFKNDGALKVGRYYFDPSREEILMDTTIFDKNYKIYNFKDIVSFTPIEEGHNQTKKHGITRAVVGGAIAGGTGAIVGAVTGGKNYDYIDKLGVVITFKNNENIRLMFLNSETKKGGFVANGYYKQFHNVCGILNGVINKNTQKIQYNTQSKLINSNNSSADEIAKFKKLADNGVITQDEFEAKKKQLLGL